MTLLMFGGIGPTEILVIALLVLLLFGSRRIPQIARGLGRGIRNFKAGVKEPDQIEEGEDPPSENARHDEDRPEGERGDDRSEGARREEGKGGS